MQAETSLVHEHLWHHLIPQEYVVPAHIFKLSKDQTTGLIESDKTPRADQMLGGQVDHIKQAVEKSSAKSLIPKVNGRIAHDLQLEQQKFKNPQDLINIMLESEYILEGLEKGQETEIVLRDFEKELASHDNYYSVIAKNGYVLAIGQKYCDHIEQAPPIQKIKKMITAAQDIMPTVALCSGGAGDPNAFIASMHCTLSQEVALKITSIRKYDEERLPHIFTKTELQAYLDNIEEHKSDEEVYIENEGVVPLVKTIKEKGDIKQLDMREYLTGNEIDTPEKAQQWKQFVKESDQKLSEK